MLHTNGFLVVISDWLVSINFQTRLLQLWVAISSNHSSEYCVNVRRTAKRLPRLSIKKENGIGLWQLSFMEVNNCKSCHSSTEQFIVVLPF